MLFLIYPLVYSRCKQYFLAAFVDEQDATYKLFKQEAALFHDKMSSDPAADDDRFAGFLDAELSLFQVVLHAKHKEYVAGAWDLHHCYSTIKKNKVLTVGKYYDREIPAFGARGWQMTIPGTPTGGPFGKNALTFHDELVTTEIGQIGTQFDTWGHQSHGDSHYNCFKTSEIFTRNGFTKLGVQNAPA